MESRTITISSAAKKHGNLNIASCGHEFFPDDIFGSSARNTGMGKLITLKVEGLDKAVKTDIPTDRTTGRPRWLFRERSWVKQFMQMHDLASGDKLEIKRVDNTTYTITPQKKNSRNFGAKHNFRATKAPRVISLFSGGGGMDLGFSATGYDIRMAVDTDEFACQTLLRNQGKRRFVRRSIVVKEDVRNLRGKDILNTCKIKKRELKVVIGGPPCQAFSVFGRREGLQDHRGSLVWEYDRLIEELEPEVFVLENVPGLRTIHNGQLYADLKESLSFGGRYAISTHLYNVANYGIPQFRERVFFVGNRNGVELPLMKTTHGNTHINNKTLPFISAGKVLEGMPEPGVESGLANHIGRVHSARIVKRYNRLSFGERDSVTRINRLNPERPSYTIIVGSDAGGGKGHVHPLFPREVTPRESARIQTFPDWWEFCGTGRHVIRQVGNAVPPLFAALLGQHIAKTFFGKRRGLSYSGMVRKLDLDFLE